MASESGSKPLPLATPAPAPVRAVVGGVVWVVCLLWFRPSWEVALVWVGALVHVPLVLGLIARDLGQGARPLHNVRFAFRFAYRLQLPAALLLVAAFQPEVRGYAGWLALPWALVTMLCGGVGVWRVATLGVRRAAALADWGMVLFAVSGVCALASLAGWRILGFEGYWLVLTAAHQMFAGLILHVVAWQILAARPGWLPVIAAVGVVIGNVLVAIGIVTTNEGLPAQIEFVAVCIYAAAVIVLGWMQLFLALWPRSGLPPLSRVLLVISDLSLGTAITLAIIYAWGTQRGLPTLTIPEMVTWHANLNVFGFALPALVGWWVAGRCGFGASSENAPGPRGRKQ